MKRISRAALAVIVLAGMATAAQAGDAEKGKALYEVCAACHGPAGLGSKELNAPAIAGQGEWYVTRQLKYFKAGVRGGDTKDIYGTQMRPMSLTLADDEAVANVAAYIATFPTVKAPMSVEGDVAAGKTAYATCAACHGQAGEGNEALNAPALRGQHDWYVQRQLLNYKNGLRGTHPDDTFGQQMRPMAMILPTDEAVANVAAYIASFE